MGELSCWCWPVGDKKMNLDLNIGQPILDTGWPDLDTGRPDSDTRLAWLTGSLAGWLDLDIGQLD